LALDGGAADRCLRRRWHGRGCRVRPQEVRAAGGEERQRQALSVLCNFAPKKQNTVPARVAHELNESRARLVIREV